MATSTELIRDYISSNITSYDRTILEQKGNHYIGEISNRYTDIIQLPNGEKVVVAYADISITGYMKPMNLQERENLDIFYLLFFQKIYLWQRISNTMTLVTF